ncbi:MAG: LysM peptidoglycan-binding domain-containing protein [Anaerolineaceae bacterium]|jgi:murein DD-endopeptidase MepM/ murein hydrolase activator NlpD|nr:LysM peptidoglycan-binding domain-containing protein [Anaerolineaceae bacterium]MDD4578606.1 LysM peptidoglycan-binding domain-containing protein [Anaerolineaceae bacterium]
MKNTNPTSTKARSNLALIVLFFIVILIPLAFVGCKRRNQDFDPFIVSTNAGDLASFNRTPQTLQSPQATPTPHQEPRLTMTPAPLSATPTAMPPLTLPTLRANEDIYTIQSGDSLAAIALRSQVSVRQIIDANDLENPDLINPGQVITIPPASANELATNFRIIPDSEIVYGPSVKDFDIESIIWQFNGKLNWYEEELDDGTILSGAQIVQRVANEQSVNPRLLLALIEHQSGCLLSRNEDCDLEEYPLGLINSKQEGLYKQLNWAANELLRGSGLWQKSLLAVWTLADGDVMRIDPSINAGTAGLQHLFSLIEGKTDWKKTVSENGFYKTYNDLFGYPFALSVDPLIPEDLAQPELILPLADGDVWLLTSGPHWAWGSGSAWAALDFAPPGEENDYGCYFSDAPVLAAADGIVVHSEGSAVVIDLDGDGYEQTGWTLNYFHISKASSIPVGTRVATGDVIGISSCEGGVTNGTHFHLARRYNGVWIDAGGEIPFNLGGWVASSYGIVYDGSLTRDGVTVEAYNGRSEINQISNP